MPYDKPGTPFRAIFISGLFIRKIMSSVWEYALKLNLNALFMYLAGFDCIKYKRVTH